MGTSRDGVGVGRLENYEYDLETRNGTDPHGLSGDGFKPFKVQPNLYLDPELLDPENIEIARALDDGVRILNDALPPEYQIVVVGDGNAGEAHSSGIMVNLESASAIGSICGETAVACAQNKTTGDSTSSSVLYLPEDLDTSEYSYPRSTIIHELLHALGIQGHVDSIEFPDSIMGTAGEYIPNLGHILGRIDREALQIIYMSQRSDLYNDWREWSDTSFHLAGRSEDEALNFGVALFNGLPQPWVRGATPDADLADNDHLLGTAKWTGGLLGFSGPSPIAGDAELEVHLATLADPDNEQDLRFRDIYFMSRSENQDLSASSARWFDTRNIDYKVNVSGNVFRNVRGEGDEQGYVSGAFIGSDHEHMGGTLKRTDMVAAFGGSRTPAPQTPQASNLVPVTHWQTNATAEDLLEHWNESNVIKSALKLRDSDGGSTVILRNLLANAEAVSLPQRQRRATEDSEMISQLIDWNEDSCSNCDSIVESATRSLSPEQITISSVDGGGTDLSAELLTVLRKVRTEDIEIIGSRDGITYGQWKGGPAGTLDIDFYWGFSPQTEEDTRVRFERAGKAWSYRILDDFGEHIARRGSDTAEGRQTSANFPEDIAIDDLLIVVHTRTGPTAGGPVQSEFERSTLHPTGDFEPWLGGIYVTNPNNAFMTSISTTAHEIGHVLGVSNASNLFPHFVEGTSWTGPATVAANGGMAMPFRCGGYATESAGQSCEQGADFAHLSGHRSIMSYERAGGTLALADPKFVNFLSEYDQGFNPDPNELVSEIDFGFLDDIGYEILDGDTASQPETYGYGAWGRYSAWGIGVERVLYRDVATVVVPGEKVHLDHGEEFTFGPPGGEYFFQDELRVSADALGTEPSALFGATHGGLTGSASYSGTLLGTDIGQSHLPPVIGDFDLSVDLSNLRGIAQFSNLAVLTNNAGKSFRRPSLEYGIDVTENAIRDMDGYINGNFFGPSHEEVAGILHDPRSAVNLLAGFGGARVPPK